MICVVITGSTRGIGFELARAFLERGACVFLNGRSEGSVARALESLGGASERLAGRAADLRERAEVQALWDAALESFGRVDVWVNNAGLAMDPSPIAAVDPARIDAIVATNIAGLMHGSAVAIAGMQAQGSGALYNMEGLGSDYKIRVEGLSVYAASKAAVRYFTDALVEELAGGPVLVGALSPGMVATDLLLDPYRGEPERWARDRPMLNLLADRPETVAPWLVAQMLERPKHGRRHLWLSGSKIMARFLWGRFTRPQILPEFLD